MARIRTVKPDFFRDETLQDLESAHPELKPMLVFAGLWTQCDRNGNFPWNPRTLKLDILPFIGYDLGASLVLLGEAKLLSRYTASDGREYGHVENFDKHQRISGKEAIEPAKFPEKHSGNNGEATEKHPVAQEGKGFIGREGKGGSAPPSILGELSPSTPIEKQVLEIAKLHPKIADPLNMSHAYQHFICEAIARHQDQVLSGTRIWAVYWKENPRFVKNVQDFFVNSEYLLTPVGTQNGPQPGYVSQSKIRRKEIAEAKAAAKA